MSLQVFAVHSGGRVLNSTNDIAAAIAECVADADTSYVLSFNAARAGQAFDEYHAIGVTVDKPCVTTRTRTGYYASPKSLHISGLSTLLNIAITSQSPRLTEMKLAAPGGKFLLLHPGMPQLWTRF